MAYRDAEDRHSRTTRWRYSPSPPPLAHHDGRFGGETTFDSLPYRRPRDVIQGPDDITAPHGQSQSWRTNDASATVIETMLVVPRNAASGAYRRGRHAVSHNYNSFDDDELPTDIQRRSSTRGRSPRLAQRSRSRWAKESRRSTDSSGSPSETETDEESETSLSTMEERHRRQRARNKRENDEHETRIRSEVEERRRPSSEKKQRPRRRRKIREIVYVEEDDDSIEHVPRQSLGQPSSSPSRHRSRLSRSASERHYSRQRSRSPVRRSSHYRPSSKTGDIVSKNPGYSKRHPRRHLSQPVNAESRAVRRPKIISGASHVTSHSTTSSNRRSSILLSNFPTESARSYSSEKPVRLVSCIACRNEFHPSKIAKLRCKHRMCGACLKRLFKLSLSDVQHMSLKCCTSDSIPLNHVEHPLSSDSKMKWNIKFAEHSTHEPIHCPGKRCGKKIKPANIRREGDRKVGKCSRCKTKVCCSCSGKWHSSRECPRDEDTARSWEQAADADQLQDMRIPVTTQRTGGLNPDAASRSIRPTVESGPTRHPPDYDKRLTRRFWEGRGEEHAGRLHRFQDEETYEGSYGDVVSVGNTAGHFMREDYRSKGDDVFVSAPAPVPVPPAPTPPAAFERPPPTDYMSGVNRARGFPQVSQDPMDRLAERFSEFRASPGGTQTGIMAPPPPPPLHHPVDPLAPMTSLRMGMGPLPPMTAPIGIGHSPPIPMLRRHTMEEDMYNMARTTRPSERVVPGRMVHDYETEAAVHAPRSRRRMKAEPKSSTLAGLTGPGRGMNRVYEWRNHVQPGMPEGESAVA